MVGNVSLEMIRFFGKDTRRISHALKVYAYAGTIAELESFPDSLKETTVLAALLHDLGIKVAEDKYGSCTYRQQEEEGPPAARAILSRLSFPANIIDRVCFLIAHHHSPQAAEDLDFRALLEADFIVNFEEGDLPLSSLETTAKKHFRTKSGLSLLNSMF
ncbi:MAG: HD domain-containing protein [Spirochaetales bacterium]|jgi:HD superfamily phosphodiesterase|nr:HD domain-containing protein [Spirochaetales bacterium]